jgi:hypothetical protein
MTSAQLEERMGVTQGLATDPMAFDPTDPRMRGAYLALRAFYGDTVWFGLTSKRRVTLAIRLASDLERVS